MIGTIHDHTYNSAQAVTVFYGRSDGDAVTGDDWYWDVCSRAMPPDQDDVSWWMVPGTWDWNED